MRRDGLHEKLNEFNNYGVLLRAPFAWRFNNHMCWNAGVIFDARVCTIACRGFCPFGGAFSRLGSAPEIIRKAPFVCNLVVLNNDLVVLLGSSGGPLKRGVVCRAMHSCKRGCRFFLHRIMICDF